MLINPFKTLVFGLLIINVTILDNLTHLSIKKSISNDHFFLLEFFLESFSFERQIIKIER